MPASFTQSQLLPILGAIVAFLFAALLILYIFRLLFGRRIKAPGPRNRPRRLDVVDTFDLDRERQLVIIRRDNTEHLLLLGGPNDVLIEASISRLEGRDTRPMAVREAAREKEAAAGSGWPAAPAPTPIQPPPTPASQPIGGVPVPPLAAEAKRRPAEAAPPPPPPPAIPPAPPLQPLPPDLFAPAPPKPAPPLAPEPATTRPAAPSRFTAPSRTGTGFTPTPRPPRQPPPPFLARTQRPATPPAAPAEAGPPPATPPEASAPPVEAPSPTPANEPAPPPPPEPPAAEAPPAPEPETPTAPAPAEADPLESLEAEMARLLGRPDSKP